MKRTDFVCLHRCNYEKTITFPSLNSFLFFLLFVEFSQRHNPLYNHRLTSLLTIIFNKEKGRKPVYSNEANTKNNHITKQAFLYVCVRVYFWVETHTRIESRRPTAMSRDAHELLSFSLPWRSEDGQGWHPGRRSDCQATAGIIWGPFWLSPAEERRTGGIQHVETMLLQSSLPDH